MVVVEIRALKEDGADVLWVLEEEAEFFGVYWGEPGHCNWVEDFECYENAVRVAHELAQDNNATVWDWVKNNRIDISELGSPQ